MTHGNNFLLGLLCSHSAGCVLEATFRATYLSDSGPQFGPHYRKWNESLEDDLTVNGQQLVQAEEDVLLFNADVKAFAEAVIAALEERFPEDQLMYSASVIDPSLIPSADGVLESDGCDDCSVNSDGSETVCCSSTSSLLLFCLLFALLSYLISEAVL